MSVCQIHARMAEHASTASRSTVVSVLTDLQASTVKEVCNIVINKVIIQN